MRLSILDYVGLQGGGARFVRELVGALLDDSTLSVEMISTGKSLKQYQETLAGLRVSFRDLPPAQGWRTRRLHKPGVLKPLKSVLKRLGIVRYQHAVPREAWDGCDLLWLPWLHTHSAPRRLGGPTACNFHDAIFFQIPGIVPHWMVSEEKRIVRRWARSPARIITTSLATQDALRSHVLKQEANFDLIRLSLQPRTITPLEPAGFARKLAGREYMFCPSNLCEHKNHETLIKAAQSLPAQTCLVLTGPGTELLRTAKSGRPRSLADLANASGLRLDDNLLVLGYLSDSEYFWVLDRAHALVMPTLAEGGGSFPVAEALARGVPVITSDIPVLKEFHDHYGGEVIWFDPRDSASLVGAFKELAANYEFYARRAKAQMDTLTKTTWEGVAREYRRVFDLAVSSSRRTK